MATKKKTTKKTNSTEKKYGWHFLPSSMMLGYGDNRKAFVGKTLKMVEKGKPDCCVQGMHASVEPHQAASFRKGFVLCRVLVSGDIDSEGDKFCGRNRTVIWAKEITRKDFDELNVKINNSMDYDYDTYDLARMAGDFPTSFNVAITAWAKKNGWTSDVIGKSQSVTINYVKKTLKYADVKKFLSERVVRTYEEILADMRHAYDVNGDGAGAEDLEDTLFNMVNNDIVCSIDNYGTNGDTAYVLKPRKR